MKKIYIFILLIFLNPLFAGQKIIEKGIMEVTNDKTGEITYKILWRVPEGKDSFWIDAVPSSSSDAFSGTMNFTIPNVDPLSAISIGDFTATESGMKRALRAIEDIYRASNKDSGDKGSSGGAAC